MAALARLGFVYQPATAWLIRDHGGACHQPAEPANYVDAEMQRSDGALIVVKQYVQPEAEAQHFAPRQAKAAEQAGGGSRYGDHQA